MSRRNIDTGGKGGETSRQCVAMAWAARSVPVMVASTPAGDTITIVVGESKSESEDESAPQQPPFEERCELG